MPTYTDALATVYARSLFELASAAGGQAKISEVAGELEQIVELSRSDRTFREFIGSPVIDKGATRAEPAPHLRKPRHRSHAALSARAERQGPARTGLNRWSARSTHWCRKRSAGWRWTCSPPRRSARASRQTSSDRIHAALDREPVLHPYTEPAMIGGLKLRIGDQLIDGSVATQLRRMKRELSHSPTGKLRDRVNRFIARLSSP